MSSDRFYADLPSLERFVEITFSENFVSFPDDWYIVITDIIGSTAAIKEGRYKEVNFLGACAIVALLNIAGNLDIPFVFGGDGASILIPGFLLPQAQQALLANQEMALRDFSIQLRVGIVPVSVVSPTHDLKIAKLRISDNYHQAIFNGGALTYATRLVKDIATAKLYQLDASNLTPNADFSGLECRWKDIISLPGEMVTLLVLATAPSATQIDQIYRDTIHKIESIYGTEHTLNPVAQDQLKLSFSSKNLALEAKARAATQNWWGRLLYLWKMRIENLLGLILMKWKIKLPGIDWGEYKTIVTEATDYRKFDDILRMVIAGNSSQSKKLAAYLEKKYKEGKLLYGLHISDRALMTCLVFERSGRQVHFIDGGDGGYALAAEEMKRRMRS